MSNPAAAPADEAALIFASARGRWVLLATVLGSAIASIDATSGRHRASRDRCATSASGAGYLPWVVAAYTLTLAACSARRRLGDKYGRKRLFLILVSGSALASCSAPFAPTPGRSSPRGRWQVIGPRC